MTTTPTPGFRDGVEAAAAEADDFAVQADKVSDELQQRHDDEAGRFKETRYAWSNAAKTVAARIRALPTPPAQPAGDVERVDKIVAKLRDSATFISDTVMIDGGWSNLRHVAADLIESLRTANEGAEGHLVAAETEIARLRTALIEAPKPVPSDFDFVTYMDWYFKIRGAALMPAGDGKEKS